MQSEWLAVPTEGMRRWLTLELARFLGAGPDGSDDGVAANFLRARPGTLRSKVLEAADGGTGDPWTIDTMVWSLLAVFDELQVSGGAPEFTRIATGGSRFTRVRAVADLFDRYHLHRPEMVRTWAAGGSTDGVGEPLSAHLRWQPRVWRFLRERIGVPSPPERFADVLDSVRSGGLRLDLPPRLVLFGFTTLPGREFVDLLSAVGARHEIHAFLLSPSRLDVAAVRSPTLAGGARRPRLRADDESAAVVEHPLLGLWGRSSRETAVLLSDAAGVGLPSPDWVDTGADRPGPTTTLLERLQADIRANRAPVAGSVDPDDDSIRIHSCFGPMREVEVARDAILHALAEDETLWEEDVVVVCPGLEAFAPLVEAAFGPDATDVAPGGDRSGGAAPRLRYRIADQSVRTTNPVLGAVAGMLELVAGRFAAAAVLDLLSSAPVRQRFGIDDDGFGVVVDWVSRSRVRWGLDTGHRARFGVPSAVTGNTWKEGLDRLLLGAAVSDGGLDLTVGDVAPIGVDSGDAEILGTLAAAVGILGEFAAWAEEGAHAVADWVAQIRQASLALFAAPDQAAWQTDALHRVLDEVLEASGSTPADPGPLVTLLDVRRLLDAKLGNEAGRPDFFRGGVTVTSMTPLRWVPFRVVCVLGLDQEFLGAPASDAADLVAAAPQLGDPDRRIEFRQSLLEAVLMAGDRLLVVRDGHDVRSNHAVPRVVAAAELVDTVVAYAPNERQDEVRARIEVAHPRHSFDEACLVRDALVAGQVWSFDPADRERARARRRPAVATTAPATTRIDVDDHDVIELDALRSFLSEPVAAFASQSLQLLFPREEEVDEVDLPVELGPLELSGIGRRLLAARQAGASDQDWLRVERRSGTLPPGALESGVTSSLVADVGALLAEAATRGVGAGPGDLYEVEVVLDDGVRVVGSVPLALAEPGSGPGRVRYARPKPTFLLEAWLDLMALVGTDPERAWRSVSVSRGDGDEPVSVVDLRVRSGDRTPADVARHALGVAVRCYRAGMREPLPLFPTLSKSVADGTPDAGAWKGRMGWGDGQRMATAFFYGHLGFRDLMDLPARAGDPDGSGGRVERWARYLWTAVDTTVEDA